MRSRNAVLRAAAAAISLFLGAADAATTLGRSYDFGFENGNLIRNWSFEGYENWHQAIWVEPRFKAKTDNVTAVTGSYVAKFSGNTGSSSTASLLKTDPFPVDPGTQYTLSFYLKSSAGNTTGIKPGLFQYSSRLGGSPNFITSQVGANYPVGVDWQLYSWTFTTSSTTSGVEISLLELSVNQGGTLYFDDVVLEKGASASPRSRITESVALVNDIGQLVQNQQKIYDLGVGNRSYLVDATEYDEWRRPTRQYANYLKAGPMDYNSTYASFAATYNSGTNGKGTLGSYPYAKVEYWDEPSHPVKANYAPGDAWSTRSMESGSYYVSDLMAPQDPTIVPVISQERPYLFTWEKGVEPGKFALSWTNERGEVVQTARKAGTVWRYTRYEYYDDGQLKKVLQPMDTPGNEADQEFREVLGYNTDGQVINEYSKDRGLRRFWYNRQGLLRFTRHESQAADQYDYLEYDYLDRPIATGVQSIGSLTAEIIAQRTSSSSPKTEHKGWIYEDLSAFQSRTGFLLSDIMPGKTLAVNGRGKVVCDYNFNKEVGLSGLSAQEKLVATFYNYDKRGDISEVYRYIGTVKTPAARIHKLTYTYDVLHRPTRAVLVDDAATVLSDHTYEYDALGRLYRVKGIGGRFLAEYQFYDWGALRSVQVGGTGTASSGTRTVYTYHSQGWLKDITATRLSSGEVVFQQSLGYEDKAVVHANVPGLINSKYDGSISQQIVKHTSDVNSLGPVRTVNYEYDALGRVLTADARKNSNASPLNALQQINYSALTWTDTEDMDARFTYDDADRIQTSQQGVATADKATYYYQGDSYKLDRVTGRLGNQTARDASKAGNFAYDARGRMVQDDSKKLQVAYGWDDMPVSMTFEASGFLNSDFQFYDASGNRISRLRARTSILVPINLDGITFFVKAKKTIPHSTTVVKSGISEPGLLGDGDRRWSETYGSNRTVIASSGETGLFGAEGRIGEITSQNKYLFNLANHQGSVIRTVGDNGEFLDADGNLLDYLSHGRSKSLKAGNESLDRTYTGKEFEADFGLYSFGARWLDPDLAMFLTPDPAGEFPDPYSFVGGDPINLKDPDGRSSEPSSGDGGGGWYGGGSPTINPTGINYNGGSREPTTSGNVSVGAVTVSREGGGGGFGSSGYSGTGSYGGSRAPGPEYAGPGNGPEYFGPGYGPDSYSGGPDGGGWGEMGGWDDYGGGYRGAIWYFRDLGLTWMQRGGATYVLGEGFTSLAKNPFQWGFGFALNSLAEMAPTNQEEAAMAGLSLVVGVSARQLLKINKAKRIIPNPGAGDDLFVGTYGQTRRANIRSGLNKTHVPHHVVQDAASSTSHSLGVTINIRRDLHALTRTYGRNANLGSNVRNLAADVRDLRNILRNAGYDRSLVNQQMQRLISSNRQVGNVP